MISNMDFMLKNQLMTMFHTGNIIIDMLSGMLLCSIIASITNIINLSYLKKKLNNLIKYFRTKKNKKTITFSCKKDYGYPDTFKAILYSINKKPNQYLSHLKFISETKYNPRIEDDEQENFFIIDEDKEIKINDDFYVCFSTFDEHQKTRDGTQKTITNFDLDVYTYTKSLEELKEFINKVTKDYEKYIIEKSIKNQYFVECNFDSKKDRIKFDKHIFSTNRSYDNIFFEQKEKVINKINFFLNNKDWYDKRGIPYTMGLLFYGDPGCGKTSLIKAIMKETKRHAISVNLSNNFDLEKFRDLILSESIDDLIIPQEKRIFILEDIDAMGDIVKDRDVKEKQEEENKIKMLEKDSSSANLLNLLKNDNKNNLSVLLNIIDGVIECPGRIIIMTTNKEKTLDKALIRPGRIDMKINFTKCNHQMILELIQLFYDKSITLDRIKSIPEYKFTPAELMEQCFSHSNIDSLITAL